MYKRIDLDNGLRVISNHMPHMESAAIGIWIASGSRNETKAISGISHFLEHMVFKGTAKRSNRRIKEEIEGRGGSLNAFTSEEITCYIAKVSGRFVDVALDVLADMVLNASLADKDIEREKTVIIEEIKMYRDLPNHHIYDVLSEAMWKGHPLGLPIAGNTRSVKSILRKGLARYRDNNYICGNIVVAVCGNIDHDAVIKKVKSLFPARKSKSCGKPRPFKNSQTAPAISIFHKETEQTRLCMGLHTFGRMHEDRYAMGLLHIILGANMSSRLFENVREKRALAYEISSEVKRYSDTGAFIINAGIDHKTVRETTGVIVDELARVKKEIVPGDELSRAKEYFNVQLAMALEDTTDHMLWLGEQVAMTDMIIEKDTVIKKIEKISSRDLRKVAQYVFRPANLNLAIIGPLKEKDRGPLDRELNRL